MSLSRTLAPTVQLYSIGRRYCNSCNQRDLRAALRKVPSFFKQICTEVIRDKRYAEPLAWR